MIYNIVHRHVLISVRVECVKTVDVLYQSHVTHILMCAILYWYAANQNQYVDPKDKPKLGWK